MSRRFAGGLRSFAVEVGSAVRRGARAVRDWWRPRRVWLDITDLPPGQYYLWFAIMEGHPTVVSDDPKPWPPTPDGAVPTPADTPSSSETTGGER